MTTNLIDLDHPPTDHDLTVAVERSETAGECRVRLFEDVALFVLALLLVDIVLWLCIDTLRSAAGADETRRAHSVLSTAVGGVIGYRVRK